MDGFAKKKKEDKRVKFLNNPEKPEDFIIRNFLEIDVAKKFEQISMTSDVPKSSLDAYKIDLDVAPLYLHEVHTHYVKNAVLLEADAASITSAIAAAQSGVSAFYKEKLEKQLISQQKLK